jgi:Na+/proline symporter
VALQATDRSALSIALAIASLINGPILGVFFLGATKRATTRSALIGMSAGIAVVAFVSFRTAWAWPWYAVIGSMTTLLIGLAFTPRRLFSQ